MATMVFTDAYVLINAVNISDHVTDVTITYSAAMLDDTTMGMTTKSNKPGLLDWELQIKALNDYAAGQLDSALFALIGAAPFSVEVRPTSAARGTGNPAYTGQGVLSTYDPISAKIGALAVASITVKPSGANGALARLTA